MTNTVGILPGAATMASYPMIAACRVCYAAAGYILRSNEIGGAVRRAWSRGDAWEVAFWCAWLQVALATDDVTPHEDYARDLDRALADLCCVERISPLAVWQSLPRTESQIARRAA